MIQDLIFPDEDDEEEMKKNLMTLMTKYNCTNVDEIEIHSSGYGPLTSGWLPDYLLTIMLSFRFVYKPKTINSWIRTRYQFDAKELESIIGKLRGQGHPAQTFNTGDVVSVEICNVQSSIQV